MSEQRERLRSRADRDVESRATGGALPVPRRLGGGEHAAASTLGGWLHENGDELAERWTIEVRSRSRGMDPEVAALVGDLLRLLTALLPPGLGAFRSQAEGILQEAAELYGNLGAHRGLAAGEAVEELQILREVVLRFLYGDVRAEAPPALDLRDLVQLNRLIDRGVTYASIGHTDTLFFSLLHGAGVSAPPTQETLAAVGDQVAAIREELAHIVLVGTE